MVPTADTWTLSCWEGWQGSEGGCERTLAPVAIMLATTRCHVSALSQSVLPCILVRCGSDVESACGLFENGSGRGRNVVVREKLWRSKKGGEKSDGFE